MEAARSGRIRAWWWPLASRAARPGRGSGRCDLLAAARRPGRRRRRRRRPAGTGGKSTTPAGRTAAARHSRARRSPAALLLAGRVDRDPHSSSITGPPPRVAARPVPLASILPGAVRLDFACLAARPRAGCGDFVGIFAPRGCFVRHGDTLSSCVVAGEKADDVSSSWLPR